MSPPYNPLDKLNLARSIETELLTRAPEPLSAAEGIEGAGVYVIYYSGPFAAYAPVRCDPDAGVFETPIYVGKAIPKGGRKGGLTKDSASGDALRARLRKHAASIEEAANLDLADFWLRHLIVDDIWIPLGENMLIESFQPLWNRVIDGFGNNDPGIRRATQYRSPWDILHPGRAFAVKLSESALTQELLIERIADSFAGRPLTSLPRLVVQEIKANEEAAEDAADDAAL